MFIALPCVCIDLPFVNTSTDCFLPCPELVLAHTKKRYSLFGCRPVILADVWEGLLIFGSKARISPWVSPFTAKIIPEINDMFKNISLTSNFVIYFPPFLTVAHKYCSFKHKNCYLHIGIS